MSAPEDVQKMNNQNYSFIIDKDMQKQSFQLNLVTILIILVLGVILTIGTYNIFISMNAENVNVYPYAYNTDKGDYDTNYLVEQYYIKSLPAGDYKTYLGLSTKDKMKAVKTYIVKMITT